MLIATLLVVAAGSLITTHLVRRMALLNDQHRNLHVQALLDSGLSIGMARIRQDYSYTGSSVEDFDGGRVRIAVERPSAQIRHVFLESFYRGERRVQVVSVFIELPGSLPEIQSWNPIPSDADCGSQIDGCPDVIGDDF